MAVVFALFLVYVFLSNRHVGVTDYVIESPRIGPDLEGFRIVQISDLHNARFGKGQMRLLDKVRKYNPDIIVLTGDIVDDSGIDAGIELVEGVAQIASSYFIPGNHEILMDSTKYRLFRESMERVGINILDKDMSISRIADSGSGAANLTNGLSVVGASSCLGLRKIVDQIVPPGSFKVVLVHYPSYFIDCAEAGADLILTGHIHGGQVRIPFVGGLISPDEGFFPKYYQGVHVHDNSTMVISRGLGNYLGIPRVFNDPELVCIELRKPMSE